MRLPVPAVLHNFPRSALLALLIPASLVIYDWATLRRLKDATFFGGIAILLVHLVRTPISETQAWLAVAHWIGSIRI